MKIFFYINLIIITTFYAMNNTDYYNINLKESRDQGEIFNNNSISITLKVAFGFKGKNIFFDKIIQGIECGKQIEAFIIENTVNKELLYNQLELKNIQFYMYLYLENNTLVWKLYSVFDKKFIKGKSYSYKEDSVALLRTILIDIWQELFSDAITPYHSFLSYLDTSFSNQVQETCIEFCHPLLSGFQKTIFRVNQNILDLSSIDSSPLQSLLFSTQNDYGTAIMKLNSHGNIIPIINNNRMLISPTVSQDGLFYINSGSLHRYYYNKIKKTFCDQILGSDYDFASVYAIANNHAILVSKNKQIYKIEYQINTISNELTSLKAHKITENQFNSVNMTYDYIDNSVIVSQKINGYYQLVAYENTQKKILTISPYHKQDPAISPCGNYIAYVAQTVEGERYIEVINKYTKEIIRVTKSPGEYRFPVWLVR
jgi:hypothetical protein